MIKIELRDNKVFCMSPYHTDFIRGAKKLNGKWSAPEWIFDARDEENVRKLCERVYGSDGSASELVDIKVTAKQRWEADKDSLYLFGKQVARAFNRDSGAKLGDGVAVLKGGFRSGGSMKHWMTVCVEGTIFELRDIPQKAVDNNSIPPQLDIEICNETVNREALENERAKLLMRIEEIDRILNS